MTDLQSKTLKDAINALKSTIDVAYECANPVNKDANLWSHVLQKLYEAKTYIEDVLDNE